MTTRKDFKIIVDLTQVFQDARRSTLVYINSTKIWHIKQLQEHLIDLFLIPEPFHLLSTGKTYLPPSEDVRILDQNDVVKVVPGTGLEDQLENSKCYVTTNAISQSNISNSKTMSLNLSNGTSHSVSNYMKSAGISLPENIENVEQSFRYMEEHNSIANNPADMTSNLTMYHSIVDDTTELDSSMKMDVSNVNSTRESNGNYEKGTQSKKKRVRYRKKQMNNSSDQDTSVTKKPRIISDVVVATSKHIRFDTPEKISNNSSSENDENDSVISNIPDTLKTPQKSLDMLLALRQTSTPMTFFPKKKERVVLESSVQHEPAENEMNKVKCERGPDIEKNGVQVQVGDVVDFKILTMDEDYSPKISNTVTAEVISISSDNKKYELKITSGKGELQGPNGKFALPDDSNVNESETAYYDREHLLELQIVKNTIPKI